MSSAEFGSAVAETSADGLTTIATCVEISARSVASSLRLVASFVVEHREESHAQFCLAGIAQLSGGDPRVAWRSIVLRAHLDGRAPRDRRARLQLA